MMALEMFYVVQNDLDQIADLMVRELKSDQSFLNQIITYLLENKGKMIRPTLVILASNICGGIEEKTLHSLGAAVEILHMATLVHDDIVDEAELRRGATTINRLYGNKLAVLTGDFLYARALGIINRIPAGVDLVSNIVAHLVQGEFMQIANSFKVEQKIENYWQLINYKTAYFIANCCKLGALVSSGEKHKIDALTAYGQYLGTAFQICDDLLDFSANARKLGKETYKDVANGIYTLPVLHALKNSDEQKEFREILTKDLMTSEDFHNLVEILERSGSLEYAFNEAAALCERARGELKIFSASVEKEMLLELTHFTLKRDY